MRKATITGRPGWQEVSAVRNDHVYEIKSTYILQPGPASLTEGLRQLHNLLTRVAGTESSGGYPLQGDETAGSHNHRITTYVVAPRERANAANGPFSAAC
jgi:hypothetical protein